MANCSISGSFSAEKGRIVLDFGTYKLQGDLTREGDPLAPPPELWTFPVGTVKYPPEHWYAATVHDLTGKQNNGYKHSGIDLNLDKSPWGDVDRGEPVFAVANGEVWDVRYTRRNLGCVVIRVEHEGSPLWVRYWHLEKDSLFEGWEVGEPVFTGEAIGHLGNYIRGDHLHFDMALDAFKAGWWLTPAIRWVDPVPVLKMHLHPKLVDAMMERGRSDWP